MCDDVMGLVKVGYPKGLIKYSTQNGVANGWSTAQMIRRGLRPRVLIYTAILVAITTAVMVSLYLRTPLKVDVIRDRGAARMVEQGRIEKRVPIASDECDGVASDLQDIGARLAWHRHCLRRGDHGVAD
ncbi:MAG: hypothetical protein R3E56_09445 [Burkholderiaceae bacterium]